MNSRRVLSIASIAVAAAALMVLAGSASATTLTSASGTTPTIEASSEGAMSLHTVFTTITCQKSTLKGTVSQHGAGVTVRGTVSTLTFADCGGDEVKVLKAGSLEAHGSATTGNGTITSTGVEVTVHTAIGIDCIFSTSNTDLGTLTGSNVTKANATLDISATIPQTGHSPFCGSKGEWTGSYKVTSPASLEVH